MNSSTQHPARPVLSVNQMLSIVIPALNEEDGIAEVVERIRSAGPALAQIGVEMEILVVDDGSEDATARIVQSLGDVRLVRHRATSGYGAALKTGFSEARGNLLAFLDADGTYPPEEFPLLCRAALEQEADVVVGSRRSGASSEMPFVRRVGNFLWSNIVSVLAGRVCIDPASGMRVFRREALRRLYPLPDGLNFTPVMSTRALHEGMRFVEIPIPYSERSGRSKLSVVHDGARFLKTILWTALEYNPAKLLGLVGAAFVAAASAIGVALLVLRGAGVTSLDSAGAFTVFVALVLAVSGVSIYSLGVTFNFLVSLFHGRPMTRGLFGESRVEKFFEARFGWLGGLFLLVGVSLGGGTLLFAGDAWTMERVWLWFLSGSAFTLFGFQLLVCWILARTLEKLAGREVALKKDMSSALAHETRPESRVAVGAATA